MKSMTNEIGPEEIFGELLLMRQEFKGAQLLLEGANDIDRFEKFVDSNTCSITNCYGKPNLLGAMKIAHERVRGLHWPSRRRLRPCLRQIGATSRLNLLRML